MNFNQAETNVVARRCSGAEMSKWYDAGVEPEYLKPDKAAGAIIDITMQTFQPDTIPEPELIS